MFARIAAGDCEVCKCRSRRLRCLQVLQQRDCNVCKCCSSVTVMFASVARGNCDVCKCLTVHKSICVLLFSYSDYHLDCLFMASCKQHSLSYIHDCHFVNTQVISTQEFILNNRFQVMIYNLATKHVIQEPS